MPTETQKVFAYITHGSRLLVFQHSAYPEAGIQVPGGTLKSTEDPELGVLREAIEETGLDGLSLMGLLGIDDFDQHPYGKDEIQHRYFYHLRLEEETPDRFEHAERDPSEGDVSEFQFEFWWSEIPSEVPWLIAGQGRFLPELCRQLDLPVGELEYQAQFSSSWSEEDTEAFLVRGRYYVPEREQQIDLICDMAPDPGEPFRILDLACGEGLLAEALLDRYPLSQVLAYDGSWLMLRAARMRLQRFGERVQLRHFELTSLDWRRHIDPVHMVVSSLAIHHLDSRQKQALFIDLRRLINPGGALVIADIFQPVGARALRLAAKSWDQEVLRRALELDGTDQFYQDFRSRGWNIFRYPDESDRPSSVFEQLRWLDEAGFVNVDVYWLRDGHFIFGGRVPPAV